MKQTLIDNYLKSKKLYQLVTNKKLINSFYIGFVLYLVLFLVLLIIGLSVNSFSEQNKKVILIISIVGFFVGLILFYFFEFLRRKANNYYELNFNFIANFNNQLLNDKLIKTDIIKADQLKSDFSFIHARFSSLLSKDINIMKKYGIYYLNNNNKNILFSYFLTNRWNYDIKADATKNYQLALSYTINKDCDFLITPKDSVFNNQYYSTKENIDGFDVYYNDNKNIKVIKKILSTLKNNELKRVFIYFNNNQCNLFWIRNNNYLCLNTSEFKLYKKDFIQYFDHIENDYDEFKNILNMYYSILSSVV